MRELTDREIIELEWIFFSFSSSVLDFLVFFSNSAANKIVLLVPQYILYTWLFKQRTREKNGLFSNFTFHL